MASAYVCWSSIESHHLIDFKLLDHFIDIGARYRSENVVELELFSRKYR